MAFAASMRFIKSRKSLYKCCIVFTNRKGKWDKSKHKQHLCRLSDLSASCLINENAFNKYNGIKHTYMLLSLLLIYLILMPYVNVRLLKCRWVGLGKHSTMYVIIVNLRLRMIRPAKGIIFVSS